MNRYWRMLSSVSWSLARVDHVSTATAPMLLTGVTARTAHLGFHGNRDEHRYHCPGIRLLCFSENSHLPSVSMCHLLPVFLFFLLSLRPVYVTCDAQQGTGGL